MKRLGGARIEKSSASLWKVVLPVLACVLAISACQESSESNNPVSSGSQSDNNEDWVKEELLTQVTNLRKELAELRKEVKSLDTKVSNLKVAGAQPSRPAEIAPKELTLKDPFAMGSSDAQIMVLEYTDYQCPFCARHSKNVLPEIKKNFVDTGKVRYAIRDYPLDFHKQAKAAAIAANCAGEQGKYWDMHTVLFNNARSLTKDLYIKTANTISLDVSAFESCLSSPSSAENVDKMLADAGKYGVTGTPKFFVGKIKDNKLVNIKAISGAQGYNVFAAAINDLL